MTRRKITRLLLILITAKAAPHGLARGHERSAAKYAEENGIPHSTYTALEVELHNLIERYSRG